MLYILNYAIIPPFQKEVKYFAAMRRLVAAFFMKI